MGVALRVLALAVAAVAARSWNLSAAQTDALRAALPPREALALGPVRAPSNASLRCWASAWDAAPASRVLFGGHGELETRLGARARAARAPGRGAAPAVVSVVATVYGGAMDRDFDAYVNALASSLAAVPWELVTVLDVPPAAAWVARALSAARASGSLEAAAAAWACEPLYEPAADALGLRLASAGLVALAQVDTRLRAPGWFEALRAPLDARGDVVAVSARDAHQWWSRDDCGRAWASPAAAAAYFADPRRHARKACAVKGADLPPGAFAVRDTANRGPLLLRKRYVDALGGLDDACFFDGGDEHDLFARAFVERGWVVGAANAGPFLHAKETRAGRVAHNFGDRVAPARGCEPPLARRLAPLALPGHNEVRTLPAATARVGT